jgi:hypothetical protein
VIVAGCSVIADEPKPQLKFAEAAFRKKVLIDLN